MKKSIVLTCKIDTNTDERIDASHVWMRERYPAFALGRSDAIRELLERGLKSIDEEREKG